METIEIRAGEISLRNDGIIELDITFEGDLTEREMADIFFFKFVYRIGIGLCTGCFFAVTALAITAVSCIELNLPSSDKHL